MKNIFITTTTFCQFSKEPMRLLSEKDFEIIFNENNRKLRYSKLKNDIYRFDGVIAGTEKYDRHMLDAAGKLKVISRVGVGLDNIDLDYASEKGIKVFKTQTSPAIAVAELALGLILDLMRKIIEQSNNLNKGVWKKQMGSLVSGKTLGIIGLGTIGKKLVEITRGFQLKYLAYDLIKDEVFAKENNVEYWDLSYLLDNADIISVHLNMTKENENLINMSKLKKMKPSSIIINTSRGEIINEHDLEIAVKDGVIAGAGLDVFQEEPYNGPLTNYENVILSPHIGSYAQEIRMAMELEAVNNLIEGLNTK